MKKMTVDGNEACSHSAYMFTEMAGIYPITPSSPMAEHLDEWSSNERLNLFNDKVKVVEMQSEAGAAGFIHGAISSGILTTTFTSSQGLLLMIPNMYKIAGEMLPLVMHVAARSIATHALSIFGDHQDIYATRSTGFAMLSSSSVQDASYLAAIAHLSAIKSSLPFMHFFDGFRTSHELSKINVLEENDYLDLIDKKALENFRKKALNPLKPVTKGTAQNDDIYFQATEVRNKYYSALPDIVNEYMEKINEKANTNYKPFNYYGSSKAKYIIVAMGSVCETIKEVIDYLNNDDYGLIEVHLYRPFSKKYFFNELPKTVEKIAVLDRTKEPGSVGEPLYLDVKSITDIETYGGRYGLSSKNTTPKDIKAVYDMLEKNPRHNFTIGITDDVTNLSLEVDNNFKINKSTEFLIYGYGSDGMVSAAKSIIKLIGDNTSNYVQGYFQYDSKKSGGVTASHIRFSEKPIRSSYYVENPKVVVCTKTSYLENFDLLNNIKENGTFILETSKDNVIVDSETKKIIDEKNIKVYGINAYELARKVGLKNKISTILETVIIKLSNVVDFELAKEEMKKYAKNKFYKKGEEIVKANYEAIDLAESYLKEVKVISGLTKKINNESVFEMMSHRKGYELKTSAFLNKPDGTFESGTSKLEKRMISDIVPMWLKQNCITCNQCSIVCPHAVIRPYLISEEEYQKLPDIIKQRCIKPIEKNLNDYYYAIGISAKDCTGCGLCINTCPGKKQEKAQVKIKLEESLINKEQEIFDYLDKNISYKELLDKNTIKGSQFAKPKLMFHGACAGCGEPAYIKLLTQLFGDGMIIANATGCSSIYGGSAPSTPYTIPWANSLFEDNAEFGYGILLANDLMKKRVYNIMKKNEEKSELITKWLENNNDYKITKEVYDNLDYETIPELKELKDYIPSRTIWTIGGDGWAYDIGYGGIDHVLSSNNNVNILVLDTQVYSNTGGQSSKSSPKGSIASFTTSGKENSKKDLARILMGYPHVYVATVSLGANPTQTIKAFKEANNYEGPSIIIAYAPCIAHGITGGLENSIEMEKLATLSGYFPLFRYNPIDKKFNLDSKNVDFSLYDEFLNRQTRYSMLKKINPSKANELLESNKQNAIERFEYYKSLEK